MSSTTPTVAIRRNKGKLAASIVKQLDDLYSEPTQPKRASEEHTSEEGSDSTGGHSRVESSLAVDRMITSGEDKYHVPLEALVIRYDPPGGYRPNEVRLRFTFVLWPGHFNAPSLHKLYFAGLLKIFDYFTREFMQGLQSYYLNLNETLITHGLRPILSEK